MLGIPFNLKNYSLAKKLISAYHYRMRPKKFLRRKIKLVLIILILGGVYLNRSYAAFYASIHDHALINPKVITQTLNGNSRQKLVYVALGDSLTAGVGTNNSLESYPYYIAEKLQIEGQTVQIKNYASPGAESEDLLREQIPLTILDSPNFVTILVGINDIHNLVSLEQFQTNMEEIIFQLKKETKAQIMLITIPYLGSSKILYPPYNLLLDLRTSQFNQVIKDLSKKYQVGFMDLYSLTKPYFIKSSDFYSGDQFHPSTDGYKLWGQLLIGK